MPAVPAEVQVPAEMQIPAEPAEMQAPAVPAELQIPAVPAEVQVPAVPAGLRHVHRVFGQGLPAASPGHERQQAGSTECPATVHQVRNTDGSRNSLSLQAGLQ